MDVTYTAIFERGPKSWGAYVPDLPGCIAVGDSLPEVRQLIAEAIKYHIELLRDEGLPIPPATSTAARIKLIKHAVVPLRVGTAARKTSAAKTARKINVISATIAPPGSAARKTSAKTTGQKAGVIEAARKRSTLQNHLNR